jgi:DNA invertase Pin-like site-specific DNA recombinase
MASRAKALAYLRVSGVGQVGGDGFERQRTAIREAASRLGIEVVDEYRDEGVSGTLELQDRPGLAALLDRLDSNGVKTVVVERADRLARDLMVGEVILGQFRECGARVLTADGQDLTASDDDPTRRLVRQVLGAVSEFEKRVLVLKLRAARQRKRERDGRCEGRRPYGWRPDEADVVLEMKHLRRKRKGQPPMSYAKIAASLNAKFIPSRTGRNWSARTVYGILTRA